MIPTDLNIEQEADLLRYLRATGRIGSDEPIEFRILSGGVSNRTVWVRRPFGEAWVIKQALSKLRVRVDWFSDPSRIHREALGLVWLDRLVPGGAITPLIFEDADHHLLAMQAVAEPHENWKTMLMRGEVDFGHVEQFANLLGRIHRNSSAQAGELGDIFADQSFFESLRIEPYYLYAAEQEPRARDFLKELVQTTRKTRLALVHGDYSPKNILVHNGQLILLDHEVIHWGDPAFDVGFALTHLLSKAHHLAAHGRSFVKAAIQFWADYQDAVGDAPWAAAIERRVAQHTLGCMLARVAGRSPLEYLTDAERARQRELVIQMMCSAEGVTQIAANWLYELERHGNH